MAFLHVSIKGNIYLKEQPIPKKGNKARSLELGTETLKHICFKKFRSIQRIFNEWY